MSERPLNTPPSRLPRASWEATNGLYTSTAPTRITVTIYVR